MIIVVSACMLGIDCTWDNRSNYNRAILDFVQSNRYLPIPVCPEQLGGLSTPRAPAELQEPAAHVLDGGGTVINSQGLDVTAAFIKGAHEALKIAGFAGAVAAILKERSPSCGSSMVYDGTGSGNIIPGRGITAELFIRNNIPVFSEETFRKLLNIQTAGAAKHSGAEKPGPSAESDSVGMCTGSESSGPSAEPDSVGVCTGSESSGPFAESDSVGVCTGSASSGPSAEPDSVGVCTGSASSGPSAESDSVGMCTGSERACNRS